jgi:predicted lipoprotein
VPRSPGVVAAVLVVAGFAALAGCGGPAAPAARPAAVGSSPSTTTSDDPVSTDAAPGAPQPKDFDQIDP